MKEIEVDVYRDSGVVEVKELEFFEHQIGYKLPHEYKNLISKHNALRPKNDCFDFQFNSKTDSRDISFYGYGKEISSNVNIVKNQQEKDQYYHDHIVIIGESANGDYICFDYRNNPLTDDPPVVLMLHDYPDANNKMLICHVADNFEQFVDSLYND
jgi:SMI1 / KNR4 family.